MYNFTYVNMTNKLIQTQMKQISKERYLSFINVIFVFRVNL